jgi:hypothetical protein
MPAALRRQRVSRICHVPEAKQPAAARLCTTTARLEGLWTMAG